MEPAFFLAFLSLAFISIQLHEISHHVVARLTCGAWGRADLLGYSLAEGCSYSGGKYVILASVAGPLTNYLLMIIGTVLILRSRRRLLGFCLVFGALPVTRLLTLFTYGDEHIFGSHLLGEPGPRIVTFAALGIMLPALAIGWLSIRNRRSWLWFTAFLIGPFLLLGSLAAMINPLLQPDRVAYVWGLPWPLLVGNLFIMSVIVALRDKLIALQPVAPAPAAERAAEGDGSVAIVS
jgi:hypothetical protein